MVSCGRYHVGVKICQGIVTFDLKSNWTEMILTKKKSNIRQCVSHKSCSIFSNVDLRCSVSLNAKVRAASTSENHPILFG